MLLGIRAGFAGLAMLFEKPRRLLLSIVPAGVGLVGTIALLVLAISRAGWAYHLIKDHLSQAGLGNKLTVPLFVLGILLLGLLGMALFLGLVAAVSAPLGNLLSAEAEAERAGKEPPSLTIGQEIVEAGRSILHAVWRLVAYLIGVAILGAVSLLIPPAAVITIPLSVVWTGAYVAYDLLDPTLSRRRMGFVEKWSYLRTHRDACAGLALVTMGVLLIPLGNLLLWPGLMMGGAVLFVDLEKDQESPLSNQR